MGYLDRPHGVASNVDTELSMITRFLDENPDFDKKFLSIIPLLDKLASRCESIAREAETKMLYFRSRSEYHYKNIHLERYRKWKGFMQKTYRQMKGFLNWNPEATKTFLKTCSRAS